MVFAVYVRQRTLSGVIVWLICQSLSFQGRIRIKSFIPTADTFSEELGPRELRGVFFGTTPGT